MHTKIIRPTAETIEDVAREVIPWAAATFPRATPRSIAAHLAAEGLELKENPDDAEEMADVALLLVQLAHRAGVNLADAMRAKLEKNKLRAWGEPNGEGYVEHIRTAPAVLSLDAGSDAATGCTTYLHC